MIHIPKCKDECVESFNEMFRNKGRNRLVVFRIAGEEVEVERVLESDENAKNGLADFEDVIAALPDQELRWMAVRFRYKTDSGAERVKSSFVSWVPDTLRRETMKEGARMKMMGVVMGGVLLKEFKSPSVHKFQANSLADFSPDNILYKISKGERDAILEETLTC